MLNLPTTTTHVPHGPTSQLPTTKANFTTIQFNKSLGFKWVGHGNMPFELLMSSNYVVK